MHSLGISGEIPAASSAELIKQFKRNMKSFTHCLKQMKSTQAGPLIKPNANWTDEFEIGNRLLVHLNECTKPMNLNRPAGGGIFFAKFCWTGNVLAQ